jgi:hypothetical protein
MGEERPVRHVAQLLRDYNHGDNLLAAARFRPYERKRDDPHCRPLRIFASDPLLNRYESRTVSINTPYEPLLPGPCGCLLEVRDLERFGGSNVERLDLDGDAALLQQGRDPASSDLMFHQQTVYAVCSSVIEAFSEALGRNLSWGFRRGGAGPDRLIIRPHAAEDRNAYYDSNSGELNFCFFRADKAAGQGVLPGGRVFTCLSQDVITHEMTHALLDGMRARFDHPTNPDVFAFHEGFADLVAILQHFSNIEAVREAVERTSGQLYEARDVYSLAEQFGRATGLEQPLRTALFDLKDNRFYNYDDLLEPHERGGALVGAILESFFRVYQKRALPLMRLHALSAVASAGLHPICGELLADLAAKIAGQFLALCIRAIDYCPPVDLRFGEYLRALITADRDLVPVDRYNFRGELIAAFGRRGIYPEDTPEEVLDLSESSLLWKGPQFGELCAPALNLARLQLAGDPRQSPDAQEIERQAGALADLVTDPYNRAEFGLAEPGANFDLPCIESIRILRRVGPDRQILFGLVAEVLQQGWLDVQGQRLPAIGGATTILDGYGRILYVIRKRVDNDRRAKAHAAFAQTTEGRRQNRLTRAGIWREIHAMASTR